MINTVKFIQEWETMESEQTEFENLYMYALYACGGDFTQFDNVELLQDEINK